MQSPPVEWTLGIGYLALLDYLRSRGDADGDTLSEVVRDAMRKHPQGERIFTAGLIVGAFALREHIIQRDRNRGAAIRGAMSVRWCTLLPCRGATREHH
jgi:hypothetical protein